MWKVLLVEDETRVRRMIKEFVNWEEMGFVIAGEAANGIEALAAIHEHSPHFILCDIMMPLMDGIELLQKSREMGFEGPFVMLTCMNEFELARQAIEYGATGYVLKLSLNVDTIRDMLAKVQRELSKPAIPARQITYREFELLYRYMWRQIHGIDDAEPEMKALQERIAASGFTHTALCVVLHGAHRIDESSLMQSGLLPSMESPVTHKFGVHGCTAFFSWLPRSEDLTPCRPEVYSAFPYSAVYASSVHLSDLESAWGEMIKLLEASWYEGTRRAVAYSPKGPIGQAAEISAQSLWNMERDLLQAFERRDRLNCTHLLAAMFGGMKQKQMMMTVVMETAERLDEMFARITGEARSRNGDWLAVASHEELRRALEERIGCWLKGWRQPSSLPSSHPEINRIVDYINGNCHKEITLKSMAEYVSLDEYYLSGLFKKKMGCTLIHYLHKVRIEQARFYLLQSTLTIGEIAERVGFANLTYFVKIFKRWMQQTPGEYRKTSMNHESIH